MEATSSDKVDFNFFPASIPKKAMAHRKSAREVENSSIPSKIGKRKTNEMSWNKNTIEISNTFDVLSDSDDLDVFLVDIAVHYG